MAISTLPHQQPNIHHNSTITIPDQMPSSQMRNQSNNKKKLSKTGRKKRLDSCPVFLRKTYQMINTCDPTIARWSDDGESFMVLNRDVFSSKVIPQYFKHNNFSSFVRQLNFYGFRKIKADQTNLDRSNEQLEAKIWRFRHDKFVKGQPDLLLDIRKSNQMSVDQEEVDHLKNKVEILEDQVSNLTEHIGTLSAVVNRLLAERSEGRETISKKRKLDDRDPIASQIVPDKIFSFPEKPSDKDLLLEDNTRDTRYTGEYSVGQYTPGSLWPGKPQGRLESFTSVASDPELIEKLFTDNSLVDDLSFDDIVDPPLQSSLQGAVPLDKSTKQLNKENSGNVLNSSETIPYRVSPISVSPQHPGDPSHLSLTNNNVNSGRENVINYSPAIPEEPLSLVPWEN